MNQSSKLDTIGVLGAGQLAMMLAEAAANIGVHTIVYAPARALTRPVGDELVVGELDDHQAMDRFADMVDVVTFETENIAIDTVETLGQKTLVRPSIEAVRVSQDRLLEKRFLRSVGAQTAPFAPVDSVDDLHQSLSEVGLPAILKTRRMGYDGKGQVRLGPSTTAAEVEQAWRSVDGQPCIVEGTVHFDAEISVVAARSVDGDFVAFEPGINEHVDGILRTTTVPARGHSARASTVAVSESAITAAIAMTKSILDGFSYVGVAGVEFFVLGDDVVVNEIAPRVHNSGHWTQLGCVISQFEQHVRAITGRPLGDGTLLFSTQMTNLIGDDVKDLDRYEADPTASIVLYGKAEVRPGRKMGHLNRPVT